MKLPPRIKVFRTRLGFDEYVIATSSKKAALEAWDVSQDLFKSGAASETDDPAAIKAALDYIGTPVILPRKMKSTPKVVKAKKRAPKPTKRKR